MKRYQASLLILILLVSACTPATAAMPTAELDTIDSAPLEQSTPQPATQPATQTFTPVATATKTPTADNLITPTRRATRTPFVTDTAMPTAEAGLRQLTAARGIDIGAAVALKPLLEDGRYSQVLLREFSMVTAENEMKFDAIQPQRGVYDFSAADLLVDFALAGGMRVRGHTLVWHKQLPEWLVNGTFSRDELISILEDHITTVMTHYKGKVTAWDVVNEAMDTSTSLWRLGIGPEFIEIAFQAARQADPDALLFYNDFGAEGMNGKSDAVYDLAKMLKEKGLIDGVGLQMHLISPGGPSRQELEENMRRLGDLGLIVHITELDVRIAPPPTQVQLVDQAAVYGEVFAACLAAPACKAIVTWGFTDRYSWIPTTYRNFGAALPFDENYLPKPAYHAILRALEK